MQSPSFKPDATYRFFIFFYDNGDLDDPQVVVKHFPIILTPENHERYLSLDDHADNAWTSHWRRTAWRYGQLGLCSNEQQGIFGFDTNEIDRPRKRERIMKSWRRFHRRHGFKTGPVETVSYPLDKDVEYDGEAFRPHP